MVHSAATGEAHAVIPIVVMVIDLWLSGLAIERYRKEQYGESLVASCTGLLCTVLFLVAIGR